MRKEKGCYQKNHEWYLRVSNTFSLKTLLSKFVVNDVDEAYMDFDEDVDKTLVRAKACREYAVEFFHGAKPIILVSKCEDGTRLRVRKRHTYMCDY